MNKIFLLTIVFLIFLVAFAYSATVDTTKSWHPLQQIKGSDSFGTVDENSDGIIDLNNYALKTYFIRPNVSASDACTRDSTTCDNRYYKVGDTVVNSFLLDGIIPCSEDKSNCFEAYPKCDSQTPLCNIVYANNSVIFENNPLMTCNGLMSFNNLNVKGRLDVSHISVGNLLIINLNITPPEYYGSGPPTEYVNYLSGLYYNGYDVYYKLRDAGGEPYAKLKNGSSDVRTYIQRITNERISNNLVVNFNIYGTLDELQTQPCPNGWQESYTKPHSSYLTSESVGVLLFERGCSK